MCETFQVLCDAVAQRRPTLFGTIKYTISLENCGILPEGCLLLLRCAGAVGWYDWAMLLGFLLHVRRRLVLFV